MPPSIRFYSRQVGPTVIEDGRASQQMQKVGGQLQDLGLEIERRQAEREYNAARKEITKQLTDFQLGLQSDGDYQTHLPKFAAEAEKIKRAYSDRSVLKTQLGRKAVEGWLADEVENRRVQVLTDAYRMQRGAMRADVANNLQDYVRTGDMGGAFAEIENAERSRTYSFEEGERARDEAAHDIAYALKRNELRALGPDAGMARLKESDFLDYTRPDARGAALTEDDRNRLAAELRVYFKDVAEVTEAQRTQAYFDMRGALEKGDIRHSDLYNVADMTRRFPNLDPSDLRATVAAIEKDAEAQAKAESKRRYNEALDKAKLIIDSGEKVDKASILSLGFEESDENHLIGLIEKRAQTEVEKAREREYDGLRLLWREDRLSNGAIDAATNLTAPQRDMWQERLRKQEEDREAKAKQRKSSSDALDDLAAAAVDPRVDWPTFSRKVSGYLAAGAITDDDQRTYYDRGLKIKAEASAGLQAALGRVQSITSAMITMALSRGDTSLAEDIGADKGRIQTLIMSKWKEDQYDESNLELYTRGLLDPLIQRNGGMFGGIMRSLGIGNPPPPPAQPKQQRTAQDNYRSLFGDYESHQEQGGVHLFKGKDGTYRKTQNGLIWQVYNGREWVNE